MATKKNIGTLTCVTCKTNNKKDSGIAFIQDSESGVSLCSQCIMYFNFSLNSILEQSQPVEQTKTLPLPFPKDIFQALNRDVVKQEHAKKAISIAVAHHYRRLRDPSIGKSNILLIGPTGTGKTELARSVAKYLNVPFASIDASSITAKGYMGEDADSVIRRLLMTANGDVELAESGIVFIDEVDKVAKRDSSGGGSGDVGTVAVQQQLLKILEGDIIQVKIPTGDGREYIANVDTSKILFVCSGAFVGLEEIVNEKKHNKNPLGLTASPKDEQKEKTPSGPIHKRVQTEHFSQFGLIPEFLGRLPVITSTESLTVEDLVRILKEPQNSLVCQFQSLFNQDDIELNFHEDFLKEVAEEASRRGIGARGLRQVMEQKLEDLNFNLDQYKGQRIEVGVGGNVLTFPKELPKAVKLLAKEESVGVQLKKKK